MAKPMGKPMGRPGERREEAIRHEEHEIRREEFALARAEPPFGAFMPPYPNPFAVRAFNVPMMERQQWILDNMLMGEFQWNMLNVDELMWLNRMHYEGMLTTQEAEMYQQMQVDQMLMEQAPPVMQQPVVQQPVYRQPVVAPPAPAPIVPGTDLHSMSTDQLMALEAQGDKLAKKIIKEREKEAKKEAKHRH
jgi:hypothetical protein